MVVFEFVVDRIWCGISAQPERFDKALAFFIGFQVLPCRPLFVRDDVGDVLINPFLKRLAGVF